MWLLGKVTRAPGDGFVPSGSRAERAPCGGATLILYQRRALAPRAGDEYVSLYTAHTRGPGCAGMENRVSGINDIENDREQIGNGFACPTRRDGNVPHSYLPRLGPHLPPHLPPAAEAHDADHESWSYLQLLEMIRIGMGGFVNRETEHPKKKKKISP